MEISGSVALVTGASGGIGRSMAALLAEHGAKVVIVDLDADAVDRTADGLGPAVTSAPLDVTDRDAWADLSQRLVEEHGGVDILCNNAGISSRRASVAEMLPGVWDRVVGVNLTGVFNGAHEFLSTMHRSGTPGHIVNSASICGLVSSPGLSAYVASKFAVVALSESLRFEVADLGIGVTALCPGFVDTDIARNSERTTQVTSRLAEASDTERAAMKERLATSLSPEVVATIAVDAIAHDRPYAFTHPEYAPAVGARMQVLLDELDRSPANPTPDDPAVLGRWWLAEAL